MFSEKNESKTDLKPCCQEDEIPNDPHLAVEALEISAHGIKKRLEESPPLPSDPLNKQIMDARAAAQMETDAKLAFMIKQSEQKTD